MLRVVAAIPARAAGWRVALICLLLVTGGPAAGAGPRTEAARLLDQGVALYQAADYRAALDRFRRAYAVYPSPKILFNLASTLEALGRDVDAAHAYALFLEQSSADGSTPRARTARTALARLSGDLGRLLFDEALSGAAITIDGNPVVLPPDRRVYVAPGQHTVVVAFSGLVRQRVAVTVAAGRQRAVTAAVASIGLGRQPRLERRPRRVWTWLAAGTSVGLAAGGVAARMSGDAGSGTIARDKGDDDDDADPIGTGPDRHLYMSNLLFAGAGVAALATGVLYVYEGRAAAVAVSPGLTGSGLGVWIGGAL